MTESSLIKRKPIHAVKKEHKTGLHALNLVLSIPIYM